jgi:uncharacterized membrane protein
MAGLVALTVPLASGAPPGANLGLRALATGAGRAVVRTAGILEVVADKLLPLPARTNSLPLLGRVVLGAVAGSGLARLYGSETRLPAVTGAAAAAAAAVVATRWRAAATARGAPDHVAALGEDLTVLLLSALALRGL